MACPLATALQIVRFRRMHLNFHSISACSVDHPSYQVHRECAQTGISWTRPPLMGPKLMASGFWGHSAIDV